MSNVHIKGDKSLFVSKNAISRLKEDVKNGLLQDSSSYLKENCDYKIIDEKEDSIYIEIYNKEQKKKEENDKENDKENEKSNKQKLSTKLKNMREKRQSERSISHSLSKKSQDIPSSILDTYARLKKLDNPIINPVDFLNNKEEYKKILEGMIPNMPSNSPYAQYYKDVMRWIQ